MKICMDYQPAVAQCAGIGRYTRVLASELAKLLDSDDELRLFYCDFKRAGKRHCVDGAEYVTFRAMPGALMQKMWHHLRFPPFNWTAGDADIYHFTNFTDRPITRGKSVVSIHDMSFVRFPQFAEKRNLKYLNAGLKRSAKNADAIITISEFSKAEIEELLPEARGKVYVTYLGIGEDFKPASEVETAAVRRELGLSRPFIMTLGTVEPRKNLEFLVDVFEQVAEDDVDLVIAGALGWESRSILERFENTRFPDQLHYLRFVPDGKLAALYSAASLFVMPSFYEGFGFTPLEAMACGTPVLTSTGGSIPEIVGSAATVIKGFDLYEWVDAVRAILGDSARRVEMSRTGLERSAGFRWENTARETLAIYKKVFGSKKGATGL